LSEVMLTIYMFGGIIMATILEPKRNRIGGDHAIYNR
jgi:hypothetical protein